MKKIVAAAAAVFFLIAAVSLQTGIDRQRAKLGMSSKSGLSGGNALIGLLGGVRTTIAAYLWIKTDRINDDYYGNLSKENELIPLHRLVTWLDHRFEDSYYVGSYQLYLAGKPDDGWNFALEGLKLNPKSSLMEFNVGQLALIYRKDYADAIRHLKRADKLAVDAREKFSALSFLGTAYRKAGMADKGEVVARRLATLDKNNPSLSSMRPDND